MKNVMMLIAMLIIIGQAMSQENPPKSAPSKKWMRKEGARIVNQFQVAVKKLAVCPLYILDGTLELFSDDALIQVSSLKSKDPKRYSPDDYFRIVNGLKCGTNPVYSNMSFDYLPVSPRDASSCFDGSCTMSFEIKQIFNGKSIKNKRNYCDVTIKRVNIFFRLDSKGSLEGKIIGIEVEQTGKCDINGNQTNLSNY